ncbi:Asp-tRNA(Asn)/Glu-tRNA(Gln) amidotransferase GatCAB subunit C, partial [bacterium]|nr:Asp-tRNA(Asn)/Glu-tRNA(Gln) amidotransferase GatCAB subunit C [bacterium]
MTTFTKEELLHIANLSGLPLAEHELDQFRQQINAILTYVDQLQTVKLGQE